MGGARERFGGRGSVAKGRRGHSDALVEGVQRLNCAVWVLLLLYPDSLGCHTKRVP